jgi:hypothetical protein
LRDHFADEETLADFIRERMTRPPKPQEEVEHAIAASKKGRNSGDSGGKSPTPKVEFTPTAAAALSARLRVDDQESYLRSRSPIDPTTVGLYAFVQALYGPDETVVLLRAQDRRGNAFKVGDPAAFARFTEIMTEYADLFAGPFFLANPVSGKEEISESTGKPSYRCEKCITAYRYLVLESDVLPKPQWASILAQLPLPIVSIVDSGGKSLHALVRVNAAHKAEYEDARQKLHRHVVPLGADPAAMTAVRLTRLPGFMRKDKLQRLLYLNPHAQGVPICQAPTTERRAA